MIDFFFFGMPIKTLGSLGKIRVGRVTGNTHIFFLALWFLRNSLFFLKLILYLAPATNQIKQFRQKSYKMWITFQ